MLLRGGRTGARVNRVTRQNAVAPHVAGAVVGNEQIQLQVFGLELASAVDIKTDF